MVLCDLTTLHARNCSLLPQLEFCPRHTLTPHPAPHPLAPTAV